MKNYLHNMLANIKNGQLAKKSYIYQNKKKICKSFLYFLRNEHFIAGYKTELKRIKIFLRYENGSGCLTPTINSIKLISKPGRRVFYTNKRISKIDSNRIFIVFSTNQGLKSITDCKKLKIGGEPFIVIN